MITGWKNELRPASLGLTPNEAVAALRERFPRGYRSAHVVPVQGGACTEERFLRSRHHQAFTHEDAFERFFLTSYQRFLAAEPAWIDFLTCFGGCAEDTVGPRALRMALERLGRRFAGPKEKLFRLESTPKLMPGALPFLDKALICQPSLAPAWAKAGSLEDFWFSNLWVQTPIDDGVPTLE